MVRIEISENLYEDFLEGKEKLDSTLSTIEILRDKDLVAQINKGLEELDSGDSTTVTFEEIDNL